METGSLETPCTTIQSRGFPSLLDASTEPPLFQSVSPRLARKSWPGDARFTAFAAPTAKRLCEPFFVSITFGIDAIERCGKLVSKAEPLTLLSPGKWQITDTHHPGRCQFDGLATLEDGLHDVGGEECQR